MLQVRGIEKVMYHIRVAPCIKLMTVRDSENKVVLVRISGTGTINEGYKAKTFDIAYKN